MQKVDQLSAAQVHVFAGLLVPAGWEARGMGSMWRRGQRDSSIIIHHLVGALEMFGTSISNFPRNIGNVHLPNWRNHSFQRGGLTTNPYIDIYIYTTCFHIVFPIWPLERVFQAPTFLRLLRVKKSLGLCWRAGASGPYFLSGNQKHVWIVPLIGRAIFVWR